MLGLFQSSVRIRGSSCGMIPPTAKRQSESTARNEIGDVTLTKPDKHRSHVGQMTRVEVEAPVILDKRSSGSERGKRDGRIRTIGPQVALPPGHRSRQVHGSGSLGAVGALGVHDRGDEEVVTDAVLVVQEGVVLYTGFSILIYRLVIGYIPQ